ncbi:MAG: hypothetical protein KatS3mg105_0367 [Gemmatales bacterium]|nr:MAG: hypothetical protein KatS3mg105_0367 [Gemmatales bacterium]
MVVFRRCCFVLSLCLFNCAAVSAQTITHGPILGHVTSDSIRIWARTSKAGAFWIEFGENAERLDHKSHTVRTSVAHDNTGVVTLTGLKPRTTYYYKAVTKDQSDGPGGKFHTLPDPARLRDPRFNPRGLFNFKFEFACGNNQAPEHGNGPSLPTYDTLLKKVKDDVDFAILNGDWLYEDARDYPAANWRKQVGIAFEQTPKVVRLAPAITGVWENYKVYLARGKNLAEWHRNVPSYFTFDDHEILDDVFACGSIGFRDRRTVFRDIGVQAWFDYLGWANPTLYDDSIHFGRARLTKDGDILSDDDADFTKLELKNMGNLHVHWGGQLAGVKIQSEEGNQKGGDPNAGVYEIVKVVDKTHLKIRPAAKANGVSSYSIGRRSYGRFRVANCDFYLLDTRSHRDLHDKSKPAKPGISMLGQQQRQWLMDEMAKSDADFFFVVSSVNFMIPHVGGGGVVKVDRPTKDDAWTVFLDEREKLIDFWDELKKPVFILTGDLHNSFAIKITDNVWEFASGPHNSVNHRPSDEGDRPANGKFQYGPRPCFIRWSTNALPDIPRSNRLFPHYCVVQVNNVFNNPKELNGERWIAFPHPQVLFQYYDGKTGKLKYAEAILAAPE